MFLELCALLLIPISVSSDFSDSLARNTFLPMASAAYGDRQQECLDKHLPGAKVSFHAEVSCHNVTSDTCSGYTVVDRKRGFIGLVFRGSNTDNQIDVEIESALSFKDSFRDGGHVLPYFNYAFHKIWKDGRLGKDFKRLAKRYPKYKLYITGHSLGGALAALGAVHIAKNKLFPAKNIVYYTFGEPRVGDSVFADLLDRLLPQPHFRVVHNRDIIAHTPFMMMKYQHHSTEVWYPNDMAKGDHYIVCTRQEDPKCSNSLSEFDFTFEPDHPTYYGIRVPAYGRSGCTDIAG